MQSKWLVELTRTSGITWKELKRGIKRPRNYEAESKLSIETGAPMGNKMMNLGRSKQLVKSARMKRKEIVQLKRSRRRTRIHTHNKSERSEDNDSGASKIWNFGVATCICQHCHAIMWHGEKLNSGSGRSFGQCCRQGRVTLPPLKEPPSYLASLLAIDGGKTSANYQQNIRSYNSMFALTSMGGTVDKNINKRRGPYVFRLKGQNYHHIGTLLPQEGDKPRFQQLYIYDTENEIHNRLQVSRSGECSAPLDESIITGLVTMLNESNTLVQSFRMARDRFEGHEYHNLTLRLLGNREQDARQCNMPSASEIAALIVKDPAEGSNRRDIVLEYKDMRPKRISELHPKFMAMQYPLLFPYGEDGFRPGIRYKENGARNGKKYITMLEYYAYRLQQRSDQSMLMLMCGNLSMQFLVDVYACIEQSRLDWIRSNQGALRTELFSGLRDAIVKGDTRTEQVGRRILLPASFRGSPRCKEQNYQDAMAICRWAGYPDLFVTFICNPKWPEIQCMLDEAGNQQKPAARPDIVVRVFMLKLKELMTDIKQRHHFGMTKASKYGKPHQITNN